MSSDLTITGTLAGPIAEGGPTASLYIGSPITSYSSSTLTKSYEESKTATLKIDSTDGAVTISLDSVASGDVVYLGCDKACTFVVNGNSFVIGDATGSSTDGGCVFLCGAAITSITVTASLTTETTVTAAVWGE